ncbi:MAG: hypothetical protein ABW054_04335 [Casimicrobiaceae bacterium]
MPTPADTPAMSDWHDELRERGSVITLRPIAIPVIWIAIVLSLLVHLTALLEWLPKLKPLTADAPGTSEKDPASTPIVARLGTPAPRPAEPPSAPQAPSAASQPTPPPRAPPVVIAQRPRVERPPTPPVVSAPQPRSVPPPEPAPQPEVRPPPPPLTRPPEPQQLPQPQPPMGGDLASYIASRRRARGASEASGSPDGAQTESETARRERIVASNLASVNTPTFNDGPKNSGGVFQILRIGYDDAEFAFFGWNREIKRRANMRIEVRRTADDADIRHAIVRKMMAIIREYEQEDFTWESVRLGRNIRLSARQRDNADLESFLMLEFFTGAQAR